MSFVPWSVIRAHAFELGADGARDALARCVALRAPAAGRMKEYERAVLQVAMHDRHVVARSHEERPPMPDLPLVLELAGSQPSLGESEALTAMVVLAVIDANAPIPIHNGDMLRDSIRNAGQHLGQMDRRVRIVADTEQENL